MSRISKTFEELRIQERKALIPFITAGDPNPGSTVTLMHRLVEAGADILELGVPFSDPMADGPVIQRASERALLHHVSLFDVIAMVEDFRQQDTKTPVVLMGYLNPVESMGYEKFVKTASDAGVDGALTVDMPPEESEEFLEYCTTYGLDPIFLIAPTTTEERMQNLCNSANGFVYYVSLKGVTGSSQIDVSALGGRLDIIRKHTDMPVGVGFGISDAETAAQVAQVADAIVVGSALVSRIEECGDTADKMADEVYNFIHGLRTAIDAA